MLPGMVVQLGGRQRDRAVLILRGRRVGGRLVDLWVPPVAETLLPRPAWPEVGAAALGPAFTRARALRGAPRTDAAHRARRVGRWPSGRRGQRRDRHRRASPVTLAAWSRAQAWGLLRGCDGTARQCGRARGRRLPTGGSLHAPRTRRAPASGLRRSGRRARRHCRPVRSSATAFLRLARDMDSPAGRRIPSKRPRPRPRAARELVADTGPWTTVARPAVGLAAGERRMICGSDYYRAPRPLALATDRVARRVAGGLGLGSARRRRPGSSASPPR